jgi:hypothetical protein
MALTKIPVIYDKLTLQVRRIIVPEDDSQLVYHQPGHGEAITYMPAIGVDPIGRSNLARAQQAVILATGRYPVSG